MVLDLHLYSFTKAALALPFRVSIFFAKCWIKPFVLYARWSRALTTWSIRLVQGIIRRSFRWQFDILFHFASYSSTLLTKLGEGHVHHKTAEDTLSDDEITSSNELMPFSITLREKHAQEEGEDSSRPVTGLGNFLVDHAQSVRATSFRFLFAELLRWTDTLPLQCLQEEREAQSSEITENAESPIVIEGAVDLSGDSSIQIQPEPETIVIQIQGVVEVDKVVEDEQREVSYNIASQIKGADALAPVD